MLIAKLKPLPDEEQFLMLLEFMERCSQACNKVSKIAFRDRNWNRVKLQKHCYYGIWRSSDHRDRRPYS